MTKCLPAALLFHLPSRLTVLRHTGPCISLSMALAAAGCITVPPKQAGTLSTYRKLGEEKGKFSKSRTYVDGQALAAAKTARIVPTSFAANAGALVTAQADHALVTNALDRELCIALSDKYEMVAPAQPADLTVRAVITDIVLTDKTMAGVSTVVTLGSSVALPVGIPRLPVGLGGLSVEAEALDRGGIQRAAMVWGRGANSIQNTPQASEVSDAYGLASTFAGEFARILVIGEEPEGLDISLPSRQRVRSWLGGSHKYATCETYGRSPGIAGLIARKFGAPPELADKQAVKTVPDPAENRGRPQPAPAH